MEISKKIKTLRKEKGVTQKRLGELAGIATITIQQYEAGKYKPKVEAVQKIATALEVSPNCLLDDAWAEVKEETRRMVDFHSFVHDFLGYDSPYCIGAKEVDIILKKEPGAAYRVPANIYEDFMDTMPEQIEAEFNKMLKWSKRIQTVPKEHQDNDTSKKEVVNIKPEQHEPLKAAKEKPDATTKDLEEDFKKLDD